MPKFHISKDGIARKCNAKGVCPLGGDEVHFKTKEEAQKYSDIIQAQKHGLLPNAGKDRYKQSNNPIVSDKRVHRYVIHKQSKYHYNVEDYDVSINEFINLGMKGFEESEYLPKGYKTPKGSSPTVAQINIAQDKQYNVGEFMGKEKIAKGIKNEDEAIEKVKDFLNYQSGNENLYVVRKSVYVFDKLFKDSAFKK